ncbi:MAG: hypothetical protein R3D85_12000 [Paracoccaceae bacterium]
MKRILATMACGLGLSGPGLAQNYMMNADPQVVQAINEIAYVYQLYCSSGSAQACNALPMIQQGAQETLMLGQNCQMGDQNACATYQEQLWELQAAHSQAMVDFQQLQTAQYGGGLGADPGLTHEQRMQQIQQWGAQNTANFNSRMEQMDRNHQSFLEMLRQ